MRIQRVLASLLFPVLGTILQAQDLAVELDEYWARVSKAVKTGDLEAYRATCHPDGVLVSGKSAKSELLSQALVRWGKEFADTKAGKMKARVEFRFSKRIRGKDTATKREFFSIQAKGRRRMETGLCSFRSPFDQEEGKWKILMEFQKSLATEAEWSALVPE